MKTAPRKRKKEYPQGIDPAKLPTRCYWDGAGKGRWYTVWEEDGKQKKRTLAKLTRASTMAELHKAIEEFYKDDRQDRSSFKWLADQFQQSDQFKQLAEGTRKQYSYGRQCTLAIKARNLKSLGDTDRSKWTTPDIQIIVDKMAKERGPSSAHHICQYLSRLFNWGVNRGFCASNPVVAIELPKERKHRPMPSKALYGKLVTYAQERASRPSHQGGSSPHYIWKILEVDYLCRLRGIEARTMTEDKLKEEGIECERVKGSNTNITKWNDRLRYAIDEALKERDRIWAQKKRPVNLKAEDRLVFVNNSGDKISSSCWQSAWRNFLKAAIKDGIMAEDEWFGLHGMKRKGITDTEGTKADKQDASGHKSLGMVDIYDQGVKTVKPTAN